MFIHVIGTGCLVQVDWWVDSDKLTVAVVDSVTVTGCLHLEFIFLGDWMGKGKVVVATFRL